MSKDTMTFIGLDTHPHLLELPLPGKRLPSLLANFSLNTLVYPALCLRSLPSRFLGISTAHVTRSRFLCGCAFIDT